MWSKLRFVWRFGSSLLLSLSQSLLLSTSAAKTTRQSRHDDDGSNDGDDDDDEDDDVADCVGISWHQLLLLFLLQRMRLSRQRKCPASERRLLFQFQSVPGSETNC